MSTVRSVSRFLVRFRPLFSPDSKWLFCCSGNEVRVFSIASGECIHDLYGHKKQVTGLQVNPRNKLQILSCSLDETVLQWDYEEGILLKKYQLHGPLYAILTMAPQDGRLLFIQKTPSEGYHLTLCDITKGAKCRQVIDLCENNERLVCVGCQGSYVVAAQKNVLFIKNMKTNNVRHPFIEKEVSFTCVACHPQNECIATGCSNGKIWLWWNFLFNKDTVKTVCHWHALPVCDVAFSPEGSYMFSGGHECVIVQWQVGTNYKQFLPRLGAPIQYITTSSDGFLYATSHSDNVIHVIECSLKICQVFQGLTLGYLGYQLTNPLPVGLLCDPRTKAVVTNGKPGHLQFYCLHSDKSLFNLDAVNQNYISPESLDKDLSITEVTKAAFDVKGDWLATVEFWEGRETSSELRLKFWFFNPEIQTYVLNTVVESPHNKWINCVQFQPVLTVSGLDTVPMVVTSSKDGEFKLWSLVDDITIYRKKNKWSCESVGFYRNLSAGDAAFAEDGSLLAVVFERIITLWDPQTNTLKTVLDNPLDRTNIRYLLFGKAQCAHLLVCSSRSYLTVWNLLTCSVFWSVNLYVVTLVQDPLTETMAAFTKEKDLFVFEPRQPSPIYCQGCVSMAPIIHAVFIPRQQQDGEISQNLKWQRLSQLYFINRNQEMLTVAEELDEQEVRCQKRLSIPQNLPDTPFSMILSGQRKNKIAEEQTISTQSQFPHSTSDIMKELLMTPAHVCPPVSSIAQIFIQSLLNKKKEVP